MNIFTQFWNVFNKTILPSRFHCFTSRSTVLITFKGRKSGKLFTTPINYVQKENTLYFTSLKSRNWWRNLKTNSGVVLTLRGRKINGLAEVFDGREEVVRELGNYLKLVPHLARYFNVSTQPDGSLNPQELLKSAENRVVIKVELTNPEG